MSVNDDIQLGGITEALNNKIDLPDNKSQSDVKVIVESYVNGSSWYRVYSDGWCEQGGNTSGTSSNIITVYFLKSYNNTPEVLVTRTLSNVSSEQITTYEYDTIQNIGTNSFQCWGLYSSSPLEWRALGYLS